MIDSGAPVRVVIKLLEDLVALEMLDPPARAGALEITLVRALAATRQARGAGGLCDDCPEHD